MIECARITVVGEAIHLSTLLGIGAVLLALPRFLRLFFRLHINGAALNTSLFKLVKRDDLRRAKTLLDLVQETAYSWVARALVERFGELKEGERRPRPEMEAALADDRAPALARIRVAVSKRQILDLASLVVVVVGVRTAASGWSFVGAALGGAALLMLLLSLRLTLLIPRHCEHHSQSLAAGLLDHLDKSAGRL
jgi:hypothetical protein